MMKVAKNRAGWQKGKEGFDDGMSEMHIGICFPCTQHHMVVKASK